MNFSGSSITLTRLLAVGTCSVLVGAGCSSQGVAPPLQGISQTAQQRGPIGKVWKAKTVFEFNVSNGQTVNSAVIRDSQGNLYGTTPWGGNASYCTWKPYGNGCGVVFELSHGASGWKQALLHTFTGAPDGAAPFYGPLFRDAAGNLYGTTLIGGHLNSAYCEKDFRGNNVGCGTVYKIDTAGVYSIIHKFKGYPSDGYAPTAGVVADGDGNLYGTTQYGGAYDYGTIFKINSKGKETILYSFQGPYATDGGQPTSALTLDAEGNLYGTTQGTPSCYTSGCGTIYKLDKTRHITELYIFGYNSGTFGPNQLTRDASGALYGTAWGGGAYGAGTVWRLSANGAFRVLHSFDGYAGGSGPYGAVLRDSKGTLYSTTNGGGANGKGTVWKLNKSVFKVIYSMPYGSSSLQNPNSGIVEDESGNLFVTAEYGGTCSACGGVFELTPPSR